MTLNEFAFVVWEREGRHQSREVYTIRTEDRVVEVKHRRLSKKIRCH